MTQVRLSFFHVDGMAVHLNRFLDRLVSQRPTLVPVPIGVDTGGAFTDFVYSDGSRIEPPKLASTPANPSQEILAGLQHSTEVLRGSTVAANALLGAKRGAARIRHDRLI
jgi:hypothetical protein